MKFIFEGSLSHHAQGPGLAKNWYLKFVQPVPVAEFINKSSLFILWPGAIRRLELKPVSEIQAIVLPSPRHMRQCNLLAAVLYSVGKFKFMGFPSICVLQFDLESG